MRSLRRNQRGYTAVEVLSALTLLAIGASGVIGMQRVTLQGSEDARRWDVGTNITNEWLSRLQRDSTQWTEPYPGKETLNISTTKWLKQVGSCFPNWCSPPAAVPAAGMTGSFDIFGRDLLVGTGGATYCAQYRLEWISSPGAAAPFSQFALMRAEVRVFWARLELNPVTECANATPDAANADTLYHFVYATTAIRENQFRE
jgi:prepilin-type N-terminal cleavage/methylation domain-containing protein